MGEALLVRKGGGAKVTIDGVKVKGELNLVSETAHIIYDKDCPVNMGYNPVVLDDELYLFGVYRNASWYAWNGLSWNYKFHSLSPISKPQSAIVFQNEIHVFNGSNLKEHYKRSGNSWVSVSTLWNNYGGQSPVICNNELHLVGGNDDYGTNHRKFNGTSWVSVSTLPIGCYLGFVESLNNEIHMINTYSSESTARHYKWNGTAWTQISTPPFTLSHGYKQGVILDNEIHIMTGTSGSHYKWDGTAWTLVNTLPSVTLLESGSVVYKGEIFMTSCDSTISSSAPSRLICIDAKRYK